MLSFFTPSPEASFPQLLVCLDKFGVKRNFRLRTAAGYPLNLDGTMVYCTFTVLSIAQAYGIGMLLMLMITSKGVAGVPRPPNSHRRHHDALWAPEGRHTTDDGHLYLLGN